MLSWFKRQVNDLVDWITGAPEPFSHAVLMPAGNYAATSVNNLINTTAMQSPMQDLQMGELHKQGVSRQDFADFAQQFASGVAYTQQQYGGTAPAAIVFTSDASLTPRYNIDTQTISIPRHFVADLLKHSTLRQSKTDPYALAPKQMAAMYGVEEAYHHYQFTQKPEKYKPLLSSRTLPDGSARYDENAIEGDAKLAVQKAMRDFGFVSSTPPVTTASQHWQEYLRQSTRPQGAASGVSY